MTLTNEDLLAISQLFEEKLGNFEEKLEEKFDKKLENLEEKLDQKLDARITPLEDRLNRVEDHLNRVEDRLNRVEDRLNKIEDLLENNVIPRLDTIEACYTETYERYKDYVDKMDTTFSDVDLLKKVVEKHSKILLKLNN